MAADEHLIGFYSQDTVERDRRERGRGRLEFARTRDILQRYLPAPPCRIADIGGGPGTHATWLAAAGYDVSLIDLVPALVEQARARTTEHPFTAQVADARDLPFADGSFDAALVLGPLYHLPAADNRQTALREARRILRPGGLLVAAAITRFAPLLDTMRARQLDDDRTRRLTSGVLVDGHLPSGAGFTSAFCHTPGQLRDELESTGLEDVELLAVEGPGWLLYDHDLGHPEGRGAPDVDVDELLQTAMTAARLIESEPTLLGASSHLLAIARTLGPLSRDRTVGDTRYPRCKQSLLLPGRTNWRRADMCCAGIAAVGLRLGGGVVAVHGPRTAGRRRAGTRSSGRARQRARRA